MTDRENLPVVINQQIVVHTGQRGSLVMRGLVAVQSKRLALMKENDALYCQARDTYNRITDDGNLHGFGDIWSVDELAELKAAFEAFQQLADRQYGKVYLPLSRFYTGYQSISENKELAQHYLIQSFGWCYANKLKNDPEIWNDLGTLYLCGEAVETNYELALYWYSKAADVGNADGMFNLCCMYESGYGVEQDDGKALHWQFKAARNGHIGAQYGLGCQYEHGDTVEQDDAQAFYWYLQAAERGHRKAYTVISRLSWEKHEFPEGDSLAYDWYAEQANAGYDWAQWFLAEACQHGRGIKQYLSEAEKWYRMAAAQNVPKAQWQLGYMYLWWSSSLEKNYEQAKCWLQKAADQGLPEAQFDLAELLVESGEVDLDDLVRWKGLVAPLIEAAVDQGYGPALLDCARFPENFGFSQNEVDEFFKKAFAWYEERAEQGDAEMQYEYGCRHLSAAPNADREIGLYWLKKAAEQNNKYACDRLGKELLDNCQVNSTQQGIHWLERAAELGNVFSCKSLGALYLRGYAEHYSPNNRNPRTTLIDPDVDIAVKWYELAISLAPWEAYELGQLYLVGEHLPQDFAAAERWLLHSANAGRGCAQIALGVEYTAGARFKQNSDAAIHWLTEASKSMALAAFELGEIYRKGEIVPRNPVKAIEWFTKYASCGTEDDDMKTANEWYGRIVQICEGKLSEKRPNLCHYVYELAAICDVDDKMQRDKAINLYCQAALDGHGKAMLRLNELRIICVGYDKAALQLKELGMNWVSS